MQLVFALPVAVQDPPPHVLGAVGGVGGQLQGNAPSSAPAIAGQLGPPLSSFAHAFGQRTGTPVAGGGTHTYTQALHTISDHQTCLAT